MTDAATKALPTIPPHITPMLFGTLMVSWAAMSAMVSFLPAVGRQTGMADNMTASVSALSGLAWVLAGSSWARLSDKIGRKPVILIGCIGFVVSIALTGAVVLAGVRHWIDAMQVFILLLFARAIFGLFGFASNPACQAYVADRTEPAQRTNAMALVASAQGLGSIVGPGLAPFMILPFLGLSGPMFIFAALGLVAFVVVALVLPRDSVAEEKVHAEKPRLTSLWLDPVVRPFAIVGVISGICWAGVVQVLGFLTIDLLHLTPAKGTAYAGAAMMSGAAVALLGQWGLVRIFRMKPPHLLFWGSILILAGDLMMAFAATFTLLLGSFCLIALGAAFIRPGLTAGASLVAPPGRQGEAAGVIMSANIVGLVFAPVTTVMLYHHWRPLPFLAAAVAMTVVLILCRTIPVLRRVV